MNCAAHGAKSRSGTSAGSDEPPAPSGISVARASTVRRAHKYSSQPAWWRKPNEAPKSRRSGPIVASYSSRISLRRSSVSQTSGEPTSAPISSAPLPHATGDGGAAGSSWSHGQ